MKRLLVAGIPSIAVASLSLLGHAAGPVVVDVPAGARLDAVRDRVRAMPADQRARGVEIRLACGTYELGDAGLMLDTRDSGSVSAPVVWRGSPGGGTRFVGGRAIPTAAFKPDPSRPGVFVADISGWRAEWPARRNKADKYEYLPYPVPELYVDGRRMRPAGWPNVVGGELDGWEDGWTTFDRVVDPGTNKVDCGTFAYHSLRPDMWVNEKFAYLLGFWGCEWRAEEIPIESIDTKAKTITLGSFSQYSLKEIVDWTNRPRRWRVMNALCELDAPGECYVDIEKSRVYVLPSRPLSEAGEMRLCWRDPDLVSLDRVACVEIRDISFGPAWRSAIAGTGVTNVVISGVSVRNVRLGAIVLHGADHCRVSDCDIADIGAGGIEVVGGDRRNLVPSGNVIENNLVHDCGKIRLTHTWAIMTEGVGDIVRHNELCNSIHELLFVDGNDCLIEYNVISNCVTGTDDSGAYHCGRNISCRGNVFRYNLFSDIGNPEFRAQTALYLDDGHSGWTIDSCVFRNVRRNTDSRGFGAVHCNGGYSNVVRNCVFVDCGRALGSRWVSDEIWKSWLKSQAWLRRIKGAISRV